MEPKPNIKLLFDLAIPVSIMAPLEPTAAHRFRFQLIVTGS